MRVGQYLDQMAILRTTEAINELIDTIFERADQDDDPLYFSDLLVDGKRSLPLQHALFADDNPKFILECLVDEWGNPVSPGEDVIRKVEKDLIRDKKPIPGHQLSTWKRQGVYDKKMMTIRRWPVDEKGCIHVNAKDALYFLSVYGIHGDSGSPISYHGRPHSEEPVDVPGHAEHKLHVHYYRFREVEKRAWEKLSKKEKFKGIRRESDEYYQAHKTKK